LHGCETWFFILKELLQFRLFAYWEAEKKKIDLRGKKVGRDCAVGIATRYGLDGPGIEYRWGRDFPHPSRPAVGPTQPSVQWVLGLSWG